MIAGFKRFMLTNLVLLLLVTQSLTSLADTPKELMREGDGYQWTTVVMAIDIVATTNEVGGDWLPFQNLSQTNRPESDFAGFLNVPVNCAFVWDKDVLNKFVKNGYKIEDRETLEEISVEEFKAMPLNKILSIMIIPSPKVEGVALVRVNLNKNNLDTNPLPALTSDLFSMDLVRATIIFDNPGLAK